MIKAKYVIVFLIMTLTLVSCNFDQDAGISSEINIVTTLFPQYDFAKKIGGNNVNVTLILPAGVEPHSYDPTPQDIIKIQNADMFIYTGEFMEPWVGKIVDKALENDVYVLQAGNNIDLLKGFHDDLEHDEADDHKDENEVDPHIWVDPNNAMQMIDNIVDAMISIDPEGEETYRINGDHYKKELEELDNEFRALFGRNENKTIVFGGHFSLGYFAKRYDLKFVTPYRSFAPDAEPTPRSIIELIDIMKESKTKVIYYEGLIDPKVARVIAEETGAEMMLLNIGSNVTKEQLEDGVGFVDLLRENLENLKYGLDYKE